MLLFFFFKQKTAYEMRISDWSSDVCSSDLLMQDIQAFEVQIAAVHDVDGTSFRQQQVEDTDIALFAVADVDKGRDGATQVEQRVQLEIGRASCRERVCKYV